MPENETTALRVAEIPIRMTPASVPTTTQQTSNHRETYPEVAEESSKPKETLSIKPSNRQKTSLLHLPVELHAEISHNLSPSDTYSLVRVCRRTYILYAWKITEYLSNLAKSGKWRTNFGLLAHGNLDVVKQLIEFGGGWEEDGIGLNVSLQLMKFYCGITFNKMFRCDKNTPQLHHLHHFAPVQMGWINREIEWVDEQIEVWRYCLRHRKIHGQIGFAFSDEMAHSLVNHQFLRALEVIREEDYFFTERFARNIDEWLRYCAKHALSKSFTFFLNCRARIRKEKGESGPDEWLIDRFFTHGMVGECLYLREFKSFYYCVGGQKELLYLDADEKIGKEQRELRSRLVPILQNRVDSLHQLVKAGAEINTDYAELEIEQWFKLPFPASYGSRAMIIPYLYLMIPAFISLGGNPAFIYAAQLQSGASISHNLFHIAIDPPYSPVYTPEQFLEFALTHTHPSLIDTPEPYTSQTPLHKALQLYLTGRTPYICTPKNHEKHHIIRSRSANVPSPTFHLQAIHRLVIHGATLNPPSPTPLLRQSLLHYAASHRSEPALHALLPHDPSQVQKWLSKPSHPRHIWTHLDNTTFKRTAKSTALIQLIQSGQKDAIEAAFDVLETYYAGVHQSECLRLLVTEMRRDGVFSNGVIYEKGKCGYAPVEVAAAWAAAARGDDALLYALVTGVNDRSAWTWACGMEKGRINGSEERREEVGWWLRDWDFWRSRVGDVSRWEVWKKVGGMWEAEWGCGGGGVEEVLYV